MGNTWDSLTSLLHFSNDISKEGELMKFEKINENQIRCTLNKADLADRELRINELAYGSEKAKELFREMMEQASYEVGFEAENIPLMIEAIPVSPDCLVLIITKVENPEELDTRFSKFTKPISMEMDVSFDEDPEIPEEGEEEEDVTTIYDEKEDQEPVPFSSSGSISDALDFLTPITNALKQARETAKEHSEKTQEEQAIQKVFVFQDMKTLLSLAPRANAIYKEPNFLYRNGATKEYHLLVTKGELTTEKFKLVCNLLSEYGAKIPYTYASTAFYQEHFDTLISGDALKVLAEL